MILKINNRIIQQFENLTVSLKYESVSSSFTFGLQFDPDNSIHKEILLPLQYYPVTIEHEGELLITGTMLSHSFKTNSKKQLVPISGYAKTGVLEDCPIPPECFPLQNNNLSLKYVADKILSKFGLQAVIDPAVADRANTAFKKLTANDGQTVVSYLAELASQKHIIVTHNEYGNVVFTEAKASQAPAFDFTNGMPGIEMDLIIDGQKMHSGIDMTRQKTKKSSLGGKANVDNPYCNIFRPRAKKQSAGDTVDTKLAAQNMLADELRSIALKIYIDRWNLTDKIIRNNCIVSVRNPELYLYEKTNFFVESVDYSGTVSQQVATLNCVLPEVYNNQPPKNIFKPQ